MTTPQLLPDRRSPPSSNEPIALAPSMIEAVSRAHAFAPAATPIVLSGESGTGKTFFAEYIHQVSRRSGNFHPFSVGTVAPQLALDELFGHVPGAYTDARKIRTGRIAAAGGGTLLLDDVQNLELSVQKQLLQVLDRGWYSPVGSDRVLMVACRMILAMTDTPDVLMRQGRLLKDLRFRFGACEIRIPLLRERRVEIPLLAQQALASCPSRTGLDGPTRLSARALQVLHQLSYEGNVRELNGVIEYAYLVARDAGCSEIGPEHLPETESATLLYRKHGDRQANRAAAERALMRTGGNVTKAAELLDVSRNALSMLMKKPRNH